MANITRFDPFHDIVDDLFKGFLVRPIGCEGRGALEAPRMKLDVVERDGAYQVTADLPGVKKEDIQVSVDGAQVTLSAEVKRERELAQGAGALHTERSYGKVSRSFTLPQDIDATKAEAKFRDGVLELTLPKKKPKSLHMSRQSRDYAAPKKVCAACQLREQCTQNKSGRTIKRHLRQEELDKMRKASRSYKAKRDIRTRQHLMERSFAKSTRYGFDQARWRGLWRMRIQEYLTCAIQNIQVMINHVFKPKKSAVAVAMAIRASTGRRLFVLIEAISDVFGRSTLTMNCFFKELNAY